MGRTQLALYLSESERINASLPAIEMLLRPRTWIHRRVETIEFLDEAHVLRRTSVDFTVPDLTGVPADPATQQALVFVPVALLKKGVLRNFSLRDEQQGALPTLTREQNVALSATMLENLAELALQKPTQRVQKRSRLRDEVYNDLVAIVDENADVAAVALSQVENASGPDAKDNKQRQIIWKKPELQTLANDLAGQFVLFVPLTLKSGDRRVIKFSYEEVLEPLRLTLWQRLGLAAVTFGVPAPSVGNGASYHAELPCPPDLVAVGADLRDARSRARLAEDPGVRQRAHLHTIAAKRDAIGSIEISFRVPSAGLLWSAVLIAWVTAAILTAGLILYTIGIGASGDTAVVLLAALPGIFAAYLVRPGEHPLLQRLASGIRALVALSATVSFAAAATLAIDLRRATRFWFWLALMMITLVIALLLSLDLARIHSIAVPEGRVAQLGKTIGTRYRNGRRRLGQAWKFVRGRPSAVKDRVVSWYGRGRAALGQAWQFARRCASAVASGLLWLLRTARSGLGKAREVAQQGASVAGEKIRRSRTTVKDFTRKVEARVRKWRGDRT
jgi:hypothetical protein